jgi:tRNA G18 (ribose-2'-O)-methylase SpoU
MSTDSSSSDSTDNEYLRPIKYNVHTVFQSKSKEEIKQISKKTSLPIHLMLLNLDGNMNIAMSIRSAAVLGCSDVWVIGRRKYDARPEVGSKNYITVHKLATIDPATFFTEHGLQPIVIEQGGQAIEDMNFKPMIQDTRPVCFIMGSESHGFSKEWLQKLSAAPHITISQYGIVRSLNVSIAASIILYEYLRQWRHYRKQLL